MEMLVFWKKRLCFSVPHGRRQTCPRSAAVPGGSVPESDLQTGYRPLPAALPRLSPCSAPQLVF